MGLELLETGFVLDDILDVIAFFLIGIEPIDHLVRIDRNESILDKCVYQGFPEPKHYVLHNLRFVDEVILHEICARVFSGHGVPVENIISFDFESVTVF